MTGALPGRPVPVPAAAVRDGDVLLVDGQPVTVVATSPSRRTDAGVLVECTAIEWSAGSARGVLRRRGAETVDRIRGGEDMPATRPRPNAPVPKPKPVLADSAPESPARAADPAQVPGSRSRDARS